MARVLAQIWDKSDKGDRFLLLDEPTSALDPAHQQLTLQIARQQADEQGMGVLVILHDLNLAARYSDQLVILKQGQVAAQGNPWNVLIPEIVYSVFNNSCLCVGSPRTSLPSSHYSLIGKARSGPVKRIEP